MTPLSTQNGLVFSPLKINVQAVQIRVFSSVQHAVFTVENLADHLPSSTARWSKVGRHGLAWLRQSGASRQRCRRCLRLSVALSVLGCLPGVVLCRCSSALAAWFGSMVERLCLMRGGGMQSFLLLPLVRWAGPPWIQPVDQRCSVQYASGLCRSMSFGCPCVRDVCTRQVMWMTSTAAFVDDFVSVRQPHIVWKLSASCV